MQGLVYLVLLIVMLGFTDLDVQVQIQGRALLVLPIAQLDSIRQAALVQVQVGVLLVVLATQGITD